ncbi:ABC transporter permease [Bacteroides timonensis]|uniref:ABC transporter permease n=1 Tax=Bacteroides timonensis TaxID=1470345 RepID=UPI0005C4B204|nr:ABC transporter permease [Bacteroides timonensis]
MKTLKYAWRFLVRSKSYTVINIIGLALSLACSIILVRYIHREIQVNTHCADAERVFIPLRDIDGNIFHGSVSADSGADTIYFQPEAIKERSYFITLSNDNVTINEKPYAVQALVADTAFFHFFNYPLKGKRMAAPEEAFVTRQFAKRAFGEKDPIGQTMEYSEGKHLTICGILDEPACKSSLTFDVVINLDLKTRSEWGRMYGELLHFMPGVDVDAINAISNVYRQSERGYGIRYNFVPVNQLYWNKELAAAGDDPEMWHYSSYSHILILIGVCLLLLLAGILNFVNIYLVFMLKRSKEYGIKKVFGVQGRTLFLQLWLENVLMISIALLLAWFFIEVFAGYANQLLESDIPYTAFDWQLSLGVWALLPLITTIYPFIKYNYLPPIVSIRSIGGSRQSVATRTVFLFIQYSITLLLIILSLYFSNHLRFLQNTPPGFRTEGILYANLIPFPKNWYSESEELRNKRWQNTQSIQQKLEECPFIEQWFCGDPSRSGILGAGSTSTLINDKDVKLNMMLMWVPVDFFKLYDLQLIEGTLPEEIDRHSQYLVVMNEAAMKAFGYTRQEDAFVRGEQALWISMGMDGNIVEGGVSLMPVEAVIKDYYTGHLTAGKKPVVYMVSSNSMGAQYQIACKPGKEKEIISYLEKARQEIFNTEEFDHHWLEEDVQALYREDRRMSTVFTLFAAISIFVSALGLFGLSLFDIRQRYREIAIRKVNGAQLRNLYSILFRKYVWVIGGASLLTMPLSYYLIYIYTRDFVVKAPVSIFIYMIAILIVTGISLGTLLWQVNKAARQNPAEVIKNE